MFPKILIVVARHREHMKIFPFGAATIFSILKENKYEVDYIDCDFEHKNIDQLIEINKLKNYDIIGISGIISCYKHVKYELIPTIRKYAPSAKIIIGGYLATSIPDLLLNRNLCEVAFLGESNESILEYLKVYNKPYSLNSIKGIAFKGEKGNIINTGIRVSPSFWSNIVPFYKYIDIDYYNSHLSKDNKYYPILVEIGCPYKCHFCFNSSGVFNHKMRDAKSVVSEIKEANNRYNFNYLNVMAENLMSNSSWIRYFCQLLDDNNLKLKWECSAHANTISKEKLKLVKKHGCYKIGIGFENFSQTILNNMNKRVKVERYKKVIKMLKRYDFEATGTCIFGYFGENSKTVIENIQFMKKNYCPYSFFWIQPYPLTIFWDECKHKNIITDDEKMIENLGEADDFVLNATELKDEELFSLKEMLENTVKDLAKHRKIKNILRYIRAQGFITAILKSIKHIRRKYDLFFINKERNS